MTRYSAVFALIVALFPLIAAGSAAAQQQDSGTASLVQLARLTPSDGRTGFGVSVAYDQDVIVVGAAPEDFKHNGAVYVYVKPAGGWTDMTETAILTPNENYGDIFFAETVAISGDTVVAGAPNAAAGSAYVFVKPKSGWTRMSVETAKLTSGARYPFGESFGKAIAIGGHTILVGGTILVDANSPDGGGYSYDAAYLFSQPDGGWKNMTPTSQLTVPGVYLSSLAIDNDTIVVASSGHKKGTGAMYVYTNSAGIWNWAAKLMAADAGYHDGVGASVAVRGDTILAGAPQSNNIHHGGTGKAYIYLKPVGGWANTSLPNAKLTPSDGALGDGFGSSVSFADNTAVIGSPGNLGVGSVYAFVQPSTGWHSTGKFSDKISAPVGATFFGTPLAATSHTVAVGLRYQNVVYVFGSPQ